MIDVTPKNPLSLAQSPLTGRIYAIRGNKREDITAEFNRFMGRPDKPQYAALSLEPWGGPEGDEE